MKASTLTNKKNQLLTYLHWSTKCSQKNDTQQLILFDFSKAFGNIERDILWMKLYESGTPLQLRKNYQNGA